MKLFRKIATILYTYPEMFKKVGICWHFKTIQTPTGLNVSTDTIFLLSSRQIF